MPKRPSASRKPVGRPRFDPARKVEYRTVSVRLEDGVVDAFQAWCRERNTNPQRLLREYIEKIMTE